MSVNKLLLWEKWRPKTMDDIILLPRVRKYFENGINGNYIFYGHYGTGKTSLARILIGKWSKDKPFLELNSSLYTSIDVLRGDIENFCKFTPMMETDSDIKYVLLDEMERTSSQFQDAFKAFIEKYNKNVRFIITTNHINKISDGIKSRIPGINFDVIDLTEEKYLKQEIYKRIVNKILPVESIEIPKSNLTDIIKRKFPDFRSTIVEIQDWIQTGGSSQISSTVSNKTKHDLYDMIYNKSADYEYVYNFLMRSFGAEGVHIMINMLGVDFINWSISEKKNIDNLFQCNWIITEWGDKLESNTDPIVLAMSIVGKFREILN